jgi:2-aminoadipate transaminase
VPGAPFYAGEPRTNTLRLSFVTVAPDVIERGIALLGRAVGEALDHARGAASAITA